jgi:hypothetical protein
LFRTTIQAQTSLRLEKRERGGGLGLGETGLSLLPVDDVPDGVEVGGLDVLLQTGKKVLEEPGEKVKERKVTRVVKVESVLPHVDTEEGNVAEERVLVSGGDSLELHRRKESVNIALFDEKSGGTATHLLGRGVVAEPRPSGTLNAESSGVDGLLEALESAKVLLDLVGEGTGRGEGSSAGRGGGEVLPEEGLHSGENVSTRRGKGREGVSGRG